MAISSSAGRAQPGAGPISAGPTAGLRAAAGAGRDEMAAGCAQSNSTAGSALGAGSGVNIHSGCILFFIFVKFPLLEAQQTHSGSGTNYFKAVHGQV